MSAPERDPKTRLSIADVAKVAEVDRSVVSRVLSNDANLKIREETRQRVKEVVQRLGYRPNPLARSLRTQKAGMLALLLPDFADPAGAAIAAGADAEALERGIVLVLGRVRGSDGVAGQLDRIGAGRVDGFLVIGGELPPAAQRRLDDEGIPWLRVNRRGSPAARRYLVPDETAAAAAALSHLAGLGHRRIGYIGAAGGARDGFLRALKRAGEDPERAALATADDFARLLRGRSRPTAVVVDAAATAAALIQAGLSVPSELSIVALQDAPAAELLSPPLTAVLTPFEQLGRRAVELLLTMPAAQSIREVLDAPVGLAKRGSTAPIGKKS